jgi:serine protease
MRRLLLGSVLASMLALSGAPAGRAAEDPCRHPSPSATAPIPGGLPFDDPFISRQWGLEQVHVPAVWARGARGAGVMIAVIDSGLDRSHPEFAGKIVPGGGDFVGASDGGCPGPEDENGHGTHVSGILGAIAGNGTGGAGVAPDSVIVPQRVADVDGVYQDADLVEGLDAAVRSGARVINLSMGSGTSQTLAGPQLAPAVEAAMDKAVAAGIVVVAAAGNLSQPICAYPASVRGVVCVAATDRDERPSFFSNQPTDPDGTAVDGTTPVRAPGGAATSLECGDETAEEPVDILSTTMPGSPMDLCTDLRGYESAAGTSMATPFVAGIAAILVSAGLDATAVRACLRATSRQPTGQRGVFTPAYGYGIVDAEQALKECVPDFKAPPPAAAPPPAPGAPPASGTPTAPAPGAAASVPALPSFARPFMARRWRRGVTVVLTCRSASACAGELSLRAGRRLAARVPVALPAGRTLAVRVRWRGKAPRVRALRARLAGAAGSTSASLRVR